MKFWLAISVAFLLARPALALGLEGLANGTSTTTTVTASLTTTGSNEVVFAAINSNCGTPNSVSGGGLTWAKVETSQAGGGSAAGFTATAAAPLSAVTITGTVQSTGCGSGPTIGVLTVFGVTGSGSVGVSTTATGTTTQAITLGGTTAGSWVIALSTDWNTQGAPTYRSDTSGIQNGHTINGSFSIDWFVCRTLSTSPGGSVTVGSSAPTASTQFSMVAIEIMPTVTPGSLTTTTPGTTRLILRAKGTVQ